jgi:hypothetical protein
VSILIVPLQVTGCIDPGRGGPAGTWKLRPEKKVLPLRVGFDGTIVVGIPPGPHGENVVVATVPDNPVNVTVAGCGKSGPKFGLVMV